MLSRIASACELLALDRGISTSRSSWHACHVPLPLYERHSMATVRTDPLPRFPELSGNMAGLLPDTGVPLPCRTESVVAGCRVTLSVCEIPAPACADCRREPCLLCSLRRMSSHACEKNLPVPPAAHATFHPRYRNPCLCATRDAMRDGWRVPAYPKVKPSQG